MLGKKKDKSPQLEVNWYADKYQSVVVTRNWFFLTTLLALGGIILMTLASYQIIPLKSVEPFVVQVDERSGAVQVVESKALKEYSANEALIRHFAVSYIKAREGYNFYTLETDRNQVVAMSGKDVLTAYRQEYSADNPNNPVTRYGVTVEKKLIVKGFTFLNKNASLGESIVQASFVVQEVSPNRQPLQYTITVTMTCVFNPASVPSDDLRIVNPLGFQVISYRSDQDLAVLTRPN